MATDKQRVTAIYKLCSEAKASYLDDQFVDRVMDVIADKRPRPRGQDVRIEPVKPEPLQWPDRLPVRIGDEVVGHGQVIEDNAGLSMMFTVDNPELAAKLRDQHPIEALAPDDPEYDGSFMDAQLWLADHMNDGAHCPTCTQWVQVYRRKIGAGMARALIELYHTSRPDPSRHYHLTKMASSYTHESAQLAWWGLIAQDDDRREDGGRSGWWKITPAGEAFARGETKVAKYAKVFDGKLHGLDDTATQSIVDALGKKFDYAELMAGI